MTNSLQTSMFSCTGPVNLYCHIPLSSSPWLLFPAVSATLFVLSLATFSTFAKAATSAWMRQKFVIATRLLADMMAMSLSCCERACCRCFSPSASRCFISFSFSTIKHSYTACSFATAASAASLRLSMLKDVDVRDAWLRRES